MVLYLQHLNAAMQAGKMMVPSAYQIFAQEARRLVAPVSEKPTPSGGFFLACSLE
jgi:hypothetical protein